MHKILIILFSLSFANLYAQNEAKMIHFNDNSNVSFQASTTNINRLFVKDDKIIKHVAPEGTFVFDKALSKDGSLYFKPVYAQKPFTLFFSTLKGHNFSALVIPVNDIGQTVEMIPNILTDQDTRWEKNTGYLALLNRLMLAMIQDKDSSGIQSQVVNESKPFKGFPNTEMTLIKVYESARLNGFVYQIKNDSKFDVYLKERKFWRDEVRAISLSDQILKPNQTGYVYSIVSKG